jgi:hypothetical protein
LDTLLSEKNTTTATLVVLNILHKIFVLSAETEKYMISGEVDVAYQQLIDLERAISDLRDKNDSLLILNSLQERAGVLRDVLSVETEKIWGQLVLFSEEGDIQLTIQKQRRKTYISTSKNDRFPNKSTSFDRNDSGSPQVT